ncbi:hypothetical protein [Nitratireductor sp. ZSWI3]|uniref:hypothetical protein n=1 Tax=Nitratireductor sp. ZSWI3 TaxID=2966359 RepID=UPI00215021E7|nr:hypothetical protein [Nitratireductor sp. ZSWI3]MCR4268040.1 hypothetical protein [Nitratireductor sp. ZSWI3]
MKSDFSAARLHLERAQDYLRGSDATSEQIRQALDCLIDAVAAEQCCKPSAEAANRPFEKPGANL